MSVRGLPPFLFAGTVILFLFVFTFLSCSNSSSEDSSVTNPLLAELDENWELWSEKGIDDYSLSYGCDYTLACYFEWVHLKVEDGVIISGTTAINDVALTADELKKYKTIDELFLYIEDYIINGTDVLVVYDEEYGYPKQYEICPKKCDAEYAQYIEVRVSIYQ